MTDFYEHKRVSITSKRQFTIPKKFYSELGFDKEAICTIKDGALVIVPARENYGGEFSEQILSELINEGYEGKALLSEFKVRQHKVRSAIENMKEAAGKAAEGETESYSFEEVFGQND